MFQRTEEQEWVDRRVAEVGRVYGAHSALLEAGVEIQEESSSQQLFCPFHDNKRTPAARFYAASGRNPSHFWCFKCRLRLDGIGLLARFKGIHFMEALSQLERRFGIAVSRKPEGIQISPTERDSSYISGAWGDAQRMIPILESKLVRIRQNCGFHEYLKFCRLLDAVQWDYDLIGSTTPEMSAVLKRAADLMDDIAVREDSLS